MPISEKELRKKLEAVVSILESEPDSMRPRDGMGRAGGLIILPELPTIIMPDLHGRKDFLETVLDWVPCCSRGRLAEPENGKKPDRQRMDVRPEGKVGESSEPGATTVRELLETGRVTLIMLGDGPNTEGSESAQRRWIQAYDECRAYASASRWTAGRSAIDEEMNITLEAMFEVMELKLRFPGNVHYLKGNHDNLADRTDHGDMHFMKYAAESAMGALWFQSVYGNKLLELWRSFELALPLVVVGRTVGPGFVASHAEPGRSFGFEEIVCARERPDVVYALIWTDNGQARRGSVSGTMANLGLEEREGAQPLWFAGHRTVPDRWLERASGRFIQFHSRERRQIVYLEPGRMFQPERDIVAL